LTKVAVESSIGRRVAFQGATAKNRALVAAFEQRLGQPLFVSRYCHLAGALGAALTLLDRGVAKTSFKGLGLYAADIPLRHETCDLCTNHCRITVAQVGAEEVGYGFLCGRDYQTRKRVNRNRAGFDLLKARREAFRFAARPSPESGVTIGLPDALYLCEDLDFWRKFFDLLGLRTVSSELAKDALEEGKRLARAEFCAPIAALHGHVQYLLERSDFVFLPFYLEDRTGQRETRRQYCYYTQFAPSLVFGSVPGAVGRVLTPLVHSLYPGFHAKLELCRALERLPGRRLGFPEVSAAYEEALTFKRNAVAKLREVYRAECGAGDDVHVVLLGRPYCVLSPSMNKRIPELFGALGVKSFFQDMLSRTPGDLRAAGPLLGEVHWRYAAEILGAAEVVARTEGAYPVLVTSFKCAPDATVIDSFKQAMAAHEKPYLVLQLDEHGSTVGYETRIEAALHSFRSHRASAARTAPSHPEPGPSPVTQPELAGKTLLFPNWDPLSLRLVVANLKREGIDARLLHGTETGMRRSMRYNSGQCIPLNIMAQEFIDYVDAHRLDPARTVLWMGEAKIACNIALYPHHIRRILRAHGQGLEKADVYVGKLSLGDISLKLPGNTYLAYLFGGFLTKMACRIRPYEERAGTTNETLERSTRLLEDAFLGQLPKEEALSQVVSWFEAIECGEESRVGTRPKVAIFGDLYARDNELMNQNLIRFIEANGGEVVTTPYSSYLRMVAGTYVRKWFVEGDYWGAISAQALTAMMAAVDRIYYRFFEPILKEPNADFPLPVAQILSLYNVRKEHTGESMDNLLKTFYLKLHYPEIALFVQVSPALCCAGLVTEAMAEAIEKHTRTPVVSITYDGTGGSKNDVLVPYLNSFAAERSQDGRPASARKDGGDRG
jgi:predicted nucleotide-binding protein (sugar kinase/HSP70/actin superfamily)